MLCLVRVWHKAVEFKLGYMGWRARQKIAGGLKHKRRIHTEPAYRQLSWESVCIQQLDWTDIQKLGLAIKIPKKNFSTKNRDNSVFNFGVLEG